MVILSKYTFKNNLCCGWTYRKLNEAGRGLSLVKKKERKVLCEHGDIILNILHDAESD